MNNEWSEHLTLFKKLKNNEIMALQLSFINSKFKYIKNSR